MGLEILLESQLGFGNHLKWVKCRFGLGGVLGLETSLGLEKVFLLEVCYGIGMYRGYQ